MANFKDRASKALKGGGQYITWPRHLLIEILANMSSPMSTCELHEQLRSQNMGHGSIDTVQRLVRLLKERRCLYCVGALDGKFWRRDIEGPTILLIDQNANTVEEIADVPESFVYVATRAAAYGYKVLSDQREVCVVPMPPREEG